MFLLLLSSSAAVNLLTYESNKKIAYFYNDYELEILPEEDFINQCIQILGKKFLKIFHEQNFKIIYNGINDD